MKKFAPFCLFAFLFCAAALETAKSQEPVVLTADSFTLKLAADGKTASLTAETGEELLDGAKPCPFATFRAAREETPVSCDSISRDGDLLSVKFGDRTARFRVESHEKYMTFELLGVEGGSWYALEFAKAALSIHYDTPEGFGATTLAMTAGTIPLAMPGESQTLGGITFRATFDAGVKIALIAAPKANLRDAMKTVCEAIPAGTMPVSRAGGPWAAETPKSRGNYIITGSAISAADAPKWIDHLQKFGIDQVDFHQGGAFRQGDFMFKPEVYPNGIADFAEVSKKFAEKDMITGLHTYAEFLASDSKYVTPLPHKDLDTMAEWKLTADLDEASTKIEVAESTAHVSTVTGFFVRNSLFLRIDDELIRFGKPAAASPFGFTECTRGACGTKVSAHKAGATVYQMTHMFGLFAPVAGSELFLEIARETARAYNEGGFGMIYLDALDGTGALVADHELVWFYDTMFVNEIIKNCETPPLIEYSTMNSNIWLCRSRMGAWDSAHRGFRPFFDKHFESNRQSADRAFLPGQIGWLAICPAAGDDLDIFQRKPLFTEDIHYLAAKTLAHGYGYSLLDIPLEGTKPAAEKCGAILKRFDSLRRGGSLSAETLEKLRSPSLDVVLTENGTLRQAHYQSFEINGHTAQFTIQNPNAAQTPYVRIENRYATEAYESAEAVELIVLDENAPAKNDIAATFDPPLDLTKTLGMGFWVCGDGGGQKINIRVESAAHLVSGHNDHFLTVDFTGWRYVPFVEADNGTRPPENWPVPCGHVYTENREKVHYNAVTSVRLMTIGDAAGLKFRTLKALPIKPYLLTNPTAKIGGKTVSFVGEIPSGHYLEYDPLEGGASAKVFNAVGSVVSEAAVQGEFTELASGPSAVEFSANTGDEAPIRAKITIRTLGENIAP